MDTPESEGLRSTAEMRLSRRRRGQTLAEFAITLPILLLLIFGVIEFGRIFQAWVTLQNAARTAARYASTGQYYEDRFFLTKETDSDPNQADGLVPCLETDDIGVQTTFRGVTIYTGSPESIFATWYNGINCDPTNENHQAMRRDMARILSIMDEARAGAAGLALGEFYPPTTLPPSLEPEDQPWYYAWDRPDGTHLNGSDTPGWFNLMICSTRAKIQSSEDDDADGRVLYTDTQYRENRFKTAIEVVRDQDSRAPICVLNEYSAINPSLVPEENRITLDNAGAPWLDAGGPGDTVSLVVTFNHPLVTPIGLAEFIPLQARRTAVVESFRSSRATRGLTGAGPILAVVPSQTPSETPSNTPSETYTPSSTHTETPTSTASATDTNTPTFTMTASSTFTPTFTRTATASFTPSRTFTSTPSSTASLTPSNTFTATSTFTPTFTRTATATFTQSFTPSNTPTRTPTFTPSQSFTPSLTPSRTASFTPSLTPSRTNTATASFTPTQSLTPSRTPSRTPSFTPSPTRTPSNTPTQTATRTPSQTVTRSLTPSQTATRTPSNTPTQSLTPSRTPSRTPSFTPSQSSTPSNTPSRTASFTPSRTASATATRTPSLTPSNTNTPSLTPSRTASFTPSRTNTATSTLTPSRTPSLTPSRTASPSPTLTPSRTFTPTPVPPVAGFTYVADACTKAATFTNTSTNATSYSWSFTSGTPANSTATNPGPIVFPAAGNYSVSLTATGPGGVDVEVQNVNIPAAPAPPSVFISMYQPLTPTPVYFNPAEGDTLRVNQQITFSSVTQGSQGAGNSTASSYEWVVVPGNVSTFPASPPPTSGATYGWTPTATGTYTVFLRGTLSCATSTVRLVFIVTTTGGGGGE